MISTQKHYKEIDSLKGFSIFLVVLGHAIIYFPINLHENIYCESLFRILSSVHLPLFFVISGFCFSYHGNYRQHFFKKIKRLLIPYFVFNLLDVIPRAMLPQFVNRSQSIADSIRDILLYGGEYWFLFTLFIIFTIFPIIYIYQSGAFARKIAVGAFLLIIAIVKIPTDIFTLSSVSYYLVFFYLGVLLKISNIKIFDFGHSKCHILIPTGLTILWLLLIFSPLGNLLEILVSLLGVVVCYYLTWSNAFNNVFERFGKYSLQIYLLNGFLLVISRTIICSIVEAPIVIICFNMLVDFVFSYLFIKYICNRFAFLRISMGMN